MITDAHIAWIKAQDALKRVAIERVKAQHHYVGEQEYIVGRALLCKCGVLWPCDIAIAVGDTLLWGQTHEHNAG